jgi:uncharacterized protein (UPF0332 family)
LTAAQLLAKAERALLSAKELLASNDPDGACNRAYYAMFDAARAALLSIKAPVLPETIKTHAGLNRAFALHVVKEDLFPAEIGKSLQQIEELRIIADYNGNPLETADANLAVMQAQIFVVEVITRFVPAAG